MLIELKSSQKHPALGQIEALRSTNVGADAGCVDFNNFGLVDADVSCQAHCSHKSMPRSYQTAPVHLPGTKTALRYRNE